MTDDNTFYDRHGGKIEVFGFVLMMLSLASYAYPSWVWIGLFVLITHPLIPIVVVVVTFIAIKRNHFSRSFLMLGLNPTNERYRKDDPDPA